MDYYYPTTPCVHCRCSSCHSPSSLGCCWPFGGCYYYWDSSGSNCSTRTSYYSRTGAGTEVHWVQGFVLTRPAMELPGTVDKEEVSAMLRPLLVCSTCQRRMVVLQEVPGLRGTASRRGKRGLRIIAGTLRNCQPLPRAPVQLQFGASIWFWGWERRKDGDWIRIQCFMEIIGRSSIYKDRLEGAIHEFPIKPFHLQHNWNFV